MVLGGSSRGKLDWGDDVGWAMKHEVSWAVRQVLDENSELESETRRKLACSGMCFSSF